MHDNIFETIQSDIEFLVSFLPARRVKDVEPGWAPMFYITGTYEGDIAIMQRIEEICQKYNLDLHSHDAKEDFVGED